jgi:hypothetical protein
MKKLIISALVMAFAVSGAFAANSTYNFPILPQPCDSSATPDSYGYAWVDNDGGGSPVFSWVDITGNGILVDGLADDNAVGPFNIGFDFPFYWYMVDHFYIGSNGYISFSSDANYSQPFPQIPSTTYPNNLVVPLACDIDFLSPYGTNECYYYSNNTDSLVVSWINVDEWNDPYDPTATHTFQLILCAADSSITFQYGEQGGTFNNTEGHVQIGIEDLVGRTGLRYYFDLNPPVQAPHDGLAIRIHADPDPNFVFNDVGIAGAQNATSGGIFAAVGSGLGLGAYVENFGTTPMDNITLNCKVYRNYVPVYNENVIIDHLESGVRVWMDFPLTYSPDAIGVYSLVFKTTTNPADNFFFNNSDTTEMHAYTMPTTLAYADTAYDWTSWQGGGGGFANEFVAPEPLEITAIRANLVDDGTAADFYIMPANDAGGPDVDNILFQTTAYPNTPTGGWVVVEVPPGIVFYTGQKFFAAILSGGASVGFGIDSSWPLSNRGWENTGTYAGSRDRSLQDMVIGVMVDGHVGIEDEGTLPSNFALNQNYPNPFNASTEITFRTPIQSKVSLEIFNLAGQKIATLANDTYDAGEHTVIWNSTSDNGKVVSSGVYFYRLQVDNRSETKKMVLIK